MASPEAGSVVERVSTYAESRATGAFAADLRALLAVVEAAKTYREMPLAASHDTALAEAWLDFIDKLDALCTPDSAETP